MSKAVVWFGAAALSVGVAFAQLAADEAMLRDRIKVTTGPDVLAYVKKRTPTPETLKKLSALMSGLEDDAQSVRQKSAEGLVELGGLARGRLAQALKEGDAEVKRRARWALERIGTTTDDASLLPAVARVLASKKPDGALEALLAFVPHVEESGTIDDMALALPALAIADGKARPAALAALASPSSAVRGAVGAALARAEKERAAVQKLLADASPGVRRRVALALLEARDKEAIPALVALAGSDSAEDADTAEGALWALAGEKAPEGPAAGDPTPRATARKGWEKWWKDVGPKFDLAKADLEGGGSPIALMGIRDLGRLKGKARLAFQIVGVDPSGNKKFTLEGFNYPWHASMSRRDRVLICESNMGRVVETDLSGKIQWSRTANQPIAAHRLRNGQLFIASRTQLIVLDRSNKEVRTINRPGYDVASAMMFDDGRISLLTTSGHLLRLDKEGKVLKTVNIAMGRGVSMPTGYRCHFGADGSMVFADYGSQTVRSFDKEGKQLWATNVGGYPSSVTRLPNGNYVVTTSSGRSRVLELDRNGKEATSKYKSTGMVLFFDRR